jgi:hypothetical protein
VTQGQHALQPAALEGRHLQARADAEGAAVPVAEVGQLQRLEAKLPSRLMRG